MSLKNEYYLQILSVNLESLRALSLEVFIRFVIPKALRISGSYIAGARTREPKYNVL